MKGDRRESNLGFFMRKGGDWTKRRVSDSVEAHFFSTDDLGCCHGCPGYDETRAHELTNQGLKIGCCYRYGGLVFTNKTASFFEECPLYGGLKTINVPSEVLMSA
jgi:hypothetical protein